MEIPSGTFATRRTASVVTPWRRDYSNGAIIECTVCGSASRAQPVQGERHLHVGTVPSVRKTRGDHHSREEVSRAGAELTAAVLSIYQPGNDTLRPILLESGMPILPGVLPIAR